MARGRTLARATSRRALLSTAVALAVLAAPAGAYEIRTWPPGNPREEEPFEFIVVANTGEGGQDYEFVLKLRPHEGIACGARAEADPGDVAMRETFTYPDSIYETISYTAEQSGPHIACGWITGPDAGVPLAVSEDVFTVRPPLGRLWFDALFDRDVARGTVLDLGVGGTFLTERGRVLSGGLFRVPKGTRDPCAAGPAALNWPTLVRRLYGPEPVPVRKSVAVDAPVAVERPGRYDACAWAAEATDPTAEITAQRRPFVVRRRKTRTRTGFELRQVKRRELARGRYDIGVWVEGAFRGRVVVELDRGHDPFRPRWHRLFAYRLQTQPLWRYRGSRLAFSSPYYRAPRRHRFRWNKRYLGPQLRVRFLGTTSARPSRWPGCMLDGATSRCIPGT